MHSVYNYYTKQLIARTPCDVELAQIKRECEFNQVFYYVETTVEPDNDATADNTAMTTRKTYIAAKKEILIEIISDGKVIGTSWVGVHYQSALYQLTTDKVLTNV